jgi:hypothetical protein
VTNALSSRPRFAELTPRQKAAICNGAGPKGWGWAVPDLVFTEPANRHDFDYWLGGGVFARWRADWRFFRGCMYQAMKRWRFPVLALTLAWAALAYWFAVRCGGAVAWHWGTPRTRLDLYRLDWREVVQDLQSKESKP